MKTVWKLIKGIIKLILYGMIAIGLGVILINGWVITQGMTNFQEIDTLQQEPLMQDESVPVLVLGAGIIDADTPSTILKLRLDKAVAFHQAFPNNPIIMSGDHMDMYYNEVAVMKKYVVSKGVKSEKVYLDHAGYSTYDSLYRLKHVLNQEKVIIITQGYHLSRALLLAEGFGMQAIGIPADEASSTRFERETREILARVKDFFVVYFKYELPQPELNYGFNLSESGDLTNEKERL